MSPRRVASRLLADIRSVFGAEQDVTSPETSSARPAATCRRRITVFGRVVAIAVRPRSDGVATLSADVDCDAASSSTDRARIRLVWQGRSHIPGLKPGDFIRASGVETDISTHLAIINPEYELVARDAQPPLRAQPKEPA